MDARTVVLVEGVSDQVALEVLAARTGRDVAAMGVAIVPMGGATTIGRFLEMWGPRGAGVRLAGLCDAAEESAFRRHLARAGLGFDGVDGIDGVDLDRAGMEQAGFYVCEADLEDELIRAVGADGVVAVVYAQGELASFDRFRRQPAQRGRPLDAQLRRFMGTRSGRKAQYARALVEALDLARVPRPLAAVLAHAAAEPSIDGRPVIRPVLGSEAR